MRTTQPTPEAANSAETRAGWFAGARRAAGRVVRAPGELLVGLVRLYQILLSPIFGGQCRFYPSCSEYFILSVRKHGAVRGGLRGIGRVLRCHPFCRGGYDPP